MAPAADKLKAALEGTSITEPRIPVISNVDAAPHADPQVIKDILSKQLTGPVMWEKTLVTLKVGMPSRIRILHVPEAARRATSHDK